MSTRANRESESDAELRAEQDYVDQLYARLDELRAESREQLASVSRNSGGSMQNRSERDAFASMYQDRLAQLDAVDERLAFGRLDFEDERRYIGRIGLSTPEREQLLVDWRAPESGTFYQATPFANHGVKLRRHLVLDNHQVASIEDEILDVSDPEVHDAAALRGEGALLAALNQKRSARMRDIVGTIQAEQDRIIRAPLAGVRVVQGGPGTGKTAVALHRAAYLLYTHRQRLGNAGVLLVGPSDYFMHYIERVLPSLGETGVVMSSLAELYPGLTGVSEDDPEVAKIKGRLDWVEIIAQAVRDRQRVPEQSQRLQVGSNTVVLTPTQVRKARDKARASGKTHNEARVGFVKQLITELTDELVEQLEESSGAGNSTERSYVWEDVRSSRDVRVALNLAWMPISAEKLISDLFSKEHRLAAAATDMLSEAEQQLLHWDEPQNFSVADVPLLDEAAELLGPVELSAGNSNSEAEREQQMLSERAQASVEHTNSYLIEQGMDGLVDAQMLLDFNAEQGQVQGGANRARNDRTWAFGHIVVDEAQELTPMQWHVLMRRNPVKSFTVVGDIAQSSQQAGQHSWSAALEPFVGSRWELEELSVNYRTPKQIADFAVSVAQQAGVQINAPVAVREGQWPPIVQHSDDPLEALLPAVAEDLEAVDSGLLAVITPASQIPDTVRVLRGVYGDRVAHDAGLGNDIVVLSPREAKGLEFDAVVVLQPESISGENGEGIGDLYVAMTRPTQRLRLLGADQRLGAGTL